MNQVAQCLPPYIVVKYGGNAMGAEQELAEFATSIAQLHNGGYWPIIVHGGGPQISALLTALNISSEFVHGYRISTPQIVAIAQMALSGQVAPELVGALNRLGLNALSLSGQDGNLFLASKFCPVIDGSVVDIGQVGDITKVNTALIDQLRSLGIIPVISGIGPDEQGELYNINADSAAGAIAGALGSYALLILTNVAGIYRHWPDPDSLINTINSRELAELLPTIDAGMVPKIHGCLRALDHGVVRAHIVDAYAHHDFVAIIESAKPAGTLIVD